MSDPERTTDSRLALRHVRKMPKTGSRRTLFDHLVGTGEQWQRNGEAECLRGLEIDDQFDVGDLLDRQVGRLLALQNSAGINSCQTVRVHRGTVAYQTTRRDKRTVLKNRRYRMSQRECAELFAPTDKESINDDHDCANWRLA